MYKKLFIILFLFLIFCFCLSLPQAQAEPPVISIDLQDASLKDVLKVFSQQAGLNFIASENVEDRKITLYLDKVSVADALNTIMNANNLTYEQKKGSQIFVVKEWGVPEIETITKVFPLQYARVKGYELARAEEEDEKEKSKKTSKKTKETEGGETGIQEVIERMLTSYGQVIEDARTNSIIVTDVPSQFPKIEKAIKELDVKLPQVMIEVEVIETSLEAIDKLGITWGSTDEGNLIRVYGATRNLEWPFSAGTSDGTAGLFSTVNLDATLAMLVKDTDTKILARPRILTLNNETAEINITADTAVASLTTTSSAEGLATQTTSAERVETGVTLKVTPQINREGEITMFIEPEVITTKQSTFFSDYVDPQIRSASTTVIVGDGQTVVIGGLIDTEDSRISRKVPILGDIPLLGRLFQKKNDKRTDKEVIIFITPHLVKEDQELPVLAFQRRLPKDYEATKEQVMEMVLDKLEEE